ncbi:hypothetical protein CGGC5_v004429 [Colletotrichum fructicola Nara gc5]|uniref:Nucleoside phosphorylase domain-containing protein n=1 Tax=Colletotrichum fructicola (strain Nara gc5) TaxID=1213859 RepID=A0A7J6JJQ1_COLFN|nr:hypothetical protein CGGC5_v004429 [Colletotrichum fructicola Nara gc5]
MGKASSSGAAAALRSSYTGLKLAILAGICGGVPGSGDEADEMILGDVIISKSVIQFDLGRQYPDKFSRKDTIHDNLGRSNLDIRSLLAIYESDFGRGRLERGCADVLEKIFIGNVASGDTVMKSGDHRDKLAQEHDIIALEMEGAGMWDQIPCIIVKGVCDYADSHKNKKWQPYAAIAAASVTKALLERYIQEDTPRSMQSSSSSGGVARQFNNTGNGTQNNNSGDGKQYVAETMTFN